MLDLRRRGLIGAPGDDVQYRGVSWCSAAGKWQARSHVDGQSHYLGVFRCSIQAALAYDANVRQLGLTVKCAKRLNFPTEEELDLLRARIVHRESCTYLVEALSKQLLEERVDKARYELKWLGEGTRADGIVRCVNGQPNDGWFGLQLKACSKLSTPRSYKFWKCTGYAGLLLCCVALDSELLWAIPGHIVTPRDLRITLGGRWDAYRRRSGELTAALDDAWHDPKSFARMSCDDWRIPQSPSHQVELRSHDLGTQLFSESGFRISYPALQHSAVDMILDGEIRLQSKARTLPVDPTEAFSINLLRGSRKAKPYDACDFDALVMYVMPGGTLKGLFVIPACELQDRGFIGGAAIRSNLRLYPEWSVPRRARSRAAKAWQAKYFVDVHGGSIAEALSRIRDLLLGCRPIRS